MAPAVVWNMMATVLVVVAVLSVAGASAQTHHVVGVWGPSLDVNSWLSGRVFRVGDKIMFKNSDSMSVVEVEGAEELASCNLTNPIRMYTDGDVHVALDKEGTRYFASGNMESCKNGLRLPVLVHPPHPPSKYDIPSPHHPSDHDIPSPHHAFEPPPYPHPHPSAAAPASAAVIFAEVLVAAIAYLMAN